VAKVINTRFCREVRRNDQTGLYSLVGSFVDLTFTNTPIGFVFVVYWLGNIDEMFRQSFALLDEAGNILDETPTSDFVLKRRQTNISTAIFYTIFPSAGRYNVNIYQDGICTEIIPMQVFEPRLDAR
jgi:uncharacterized protein DUF6941